MRFGAWQPHLFVRCRLVATDQLALIVSVVSALTASLALGWNIYRDLVMKPRLVVSVAVVTILHDSLPNRPRYVNLTAVNHGPGTVTVSSIIAMNTSIWHRMTRTVQYAYVTPDYANPYGGRIPAKLEPGEKVELFLPFDSECVLGQMLSHVGVSDFFGRNHWASQASMKAARAAWKREFGGTA